MSAIGELIVFLIYFILSIPILIFLIGLIKSKGKQITKKRLIWLIISTILLILYGYAQYSSHRKAELDYVGIYQLTEYPDCDSCILELMSDNYYIVREKQNIIEKGRWKYKSGGDYWIVYLGEFGQLGTGKFRYEKRNNGFTRKGD